MIKLQHRDRHFNFVPILEHPRVPRIFSSLLHQLVGMTCSSVPVFPWVVSGVQPDLGYRINHSNVARQAGLQVLRHGQHEFVNYQSRPVSVPCENVKFPDSRTLPEPEHIGWNVT